MKSITDETIAVSLPEDAEFVQKWHEWLNNDLSKAYRVLLGDKHPIQDVLSLPIPYVDTSQEQDEQLAMLLENCLLIQELRENEEEFQAKIEAHNLSITQIYQAFVLEVARLWRVVNPAFGMIRRIWYKGFKVFGETLRKNEFSDSDNSTLGIAIKNWVSHSSMLYANLFVQDISRKIFHNDYGDRGWKNVFLAVEKNAAIKELTPLGDIIGAMFAVSGQGVPSIAAAEKMIVLKHLRYIKNNHPEIKTIILAIVSDYDHAGVNGVAGGFIQQFKMMCQKFDLELIFQRVGLNPKHVPLHRLKPAFALYSPKLRAVIRCKECQEKVYICESCGKALYRKKEPSQCPKKDNTGEKCQGETFTEIIVNTKVKTSDCTKMGFLRKEDRNAVRADPSLAQKFINKEPCGVCGALNQELSLEATPWFGVKGVPYCRTHDICHTVDIEEFSDETKFKLDSSCLIERYGIELDALGASYYFNDITNFIYEQLTIAGVSDWSRTKQLPEYYEYDEIVDKIVSEIGKENEVYSKLSDLIDQAQGAFSKLNHERDSVIKELKDLLMDRKGELLEQPDWDDRQREWDDSIELIWYRCEEELCEHQWTDSDEWNTCPLCESGQITELGRGNWSEESVKDMHDTHWNLVKHAVKIKKDFHDYFHGTLGFAKNQLTGKLKDVLDEEIENQELDLPELDDESPYLAKEFKLIPEATNRTLRKCVELFIKVGVDSEEFGILFEEDEIELLEKLVEEIEEEEAGSD